MVERTGSFAVFPVTRRKLNEPSFEPRRIAELIAEELRVAQKPDSAVARFAHTTRIPLPKRPKPA